MGTEQRERQLSVRRRLQRVKRSRPRITLVELEVELPPGALRQVSERILARVALGKNEQVVKNVSPGVDVVEVTDKELVLKETTFELDSLKRPRRLSLRRLKSTRGKPRSSV